MLKDKKILISHLRDFVHHTHYGVMVCFGLAQRTLRAGKLNEKILQLFIATGKDEVLSVIRELNIHPVITPVLPTRCCERKF